MGLRLIADIETDGLLDSMTTMHSLVIRDADTGDLVSSCTDHPDGRSHGYDPIATGLSMLGEADVVYGHNFVKFDYPAIRQLYPEFTLPKERIFDTLVVCQFLWPHVAEWDFTAARRAQFPGHLVGLHTLEAWGHRLKCHKGEYTHWCKEQGVDPWESWRPEMQTYCEQDTLTTLALLRRIQRDGPLPGMAVEMEHSLAWYLAAQERNGWPFDLEAAQSLYARLSARREELSQALRDHFGTWVAPDSSKAHPGGLTVPKVSNRSRGIHKGCAYTRIKHVEFSPSSRDHIAERMQTLYGWKPESFTANGKPKLDEDTLKAMEFPIKELLIEYLVVEKRLGLLSEGKQAWLNHVRAGADGIHRIHGRCKQNHAVTHRASHTSPNIAQVPSVGSAYGAECRALFHVPEGWVQIGADASGLELRCLAHYMARYDDGAYTDVVLNGDIHTVNQAAAGLPTRNAAKTFIYAFLYGAGDELVGAILNPEGGDEEKKRAGQAVKRRFLKGLPALGNLIAAVQGRAADPRYLVMPDGRKTHIRHKHAALNSLLQASGAIICKLWITLFAAELEARFGPQGWGGQWAALGWIHDEVQLAVRPEIAEEVKEILVSKIRQVGDILQWRCPLDGEAKTGRNWAETH